LTTIAYRHVILLNIGLKFLISLRASSVVLNPYLIDLPTSELGLRISSFKNLTAASICTVLEEDPRYHL
jgi:hypothetical protein